MKKRLVSVLISVALVLSILPSTIMADPLNEGENVESTVDSDSTSTDSDVENVIQSDENSSEESTAEDPSTGEESDPSDPSSLENPLDPTLDPTVDPNAEQPLEEQLVFEDIAEGYYKIVSALGSGNLNLEIAKGEDKNFANAQIGTDNSDTNQIFKLTKSVDANGQPVYTITPFCSKANRNLDIYGAKIANLTNVSIYDPNTTNAQKFYFVKGVDGTYEIQSALNAGKTRMVLDVYAAQAKSGTNVSIYASNGSKAQKWSLVPTTPPEIFTEGYYKIRSLANPSKVLTIDGNIYDIKQNISVAAEDSSKTQVFNIKGISGKNGSYSLIIPNSSNVADVYGAKSAAGTNVWTYAGNGSNAQAWQMVNTGEKDGSGKAIYKLKSKLGNVYLGDKDGNAEIAADPNADTAKWVLETAEKPNAPEIAEGIYTIKCKGDTSKVLDIYGSSTSVKAQVDIYTSNNTTAQKFKIKKTTDGYYTIQAMNSGMYINVYGAKAANGTQIWQYTNDGTKALKFRIEPTGDNDGSFYIMYYNTNFCLDVYGAKFTNLNKIWLYQKNGSKAQKFYFTGTTFSKGWQNYLGVYRYLKDADGNYYKSCKTPDGFEVDANGARKEQWVVKNGYYRYQLANGTLVEDVRPYLPKLFGTKYVNTYFGNQVAPKCSYKATVDRTRCLVTIYTKYPGTNSWNLPVCAFVCSPGKNATPTDAGNWTTCQLAGTWALLMGPSYGQYATRIHDSELFHSVACGRMNRYNLDAGTYNALGTKQSHGCVRLDVRNAYWIYYFCGVGMPVYVGDNLAKPINNVRQPKMTGATAIDPTDPYYTGNVGYADTNTYYGSYYF